MIGLALAAIVSAFFLFVPPIAQDQSHHLFDWLLAILLACGIASVLWWNVTGDLRFYVVVQFGPLLILVPALWFVHNARYLTAALTCYALAKLAEFYDRAVFASLPISGHTIKHVLAAIATYFIFRWRMAAACFAIGESRLAKSAEPAVS